MGARVIQASARVRLACGGAIQLLPYASTWSFTQVDGDLSPRGAGLCTLPYLACKVLALPTTNNFTQYNSLCILPCIMPQVVTNLGRSSHVT